MAGEHGACVSQLTDASSRQCVLWPFTGMAQCCSGAALVGALG